MIVFYDKAMNILPAIDFIEIVWQRKWKEPGTFSIYTIAKKWDNRIKYITIDGRHETGIVQKVVVEKKIEGTFITASGLFAEKALNWMVARSDWNVYAAKSEYPEYNDWVISKIGGELLNLNALKQGDEPRPTFINGVWPTEDSEWPDPFSMSIEAGKEIGTSLYEYLIPNNMSYYVVLHPSIAYVAWAEPWLKNPDEPHFMFRVGTIKGRDLSDKVFFGEGYQNVAKIEYAYDDSGAVPYIEIRQTMESTGFSNEEVITDESGNQKGRIHEYLVDSNNRPKDIDVYPRMIVEGNVSGIELKPENETTIRAQLQQKAREEMLNHYKSEIISIDILQNTFKYLEDYNIGDTCTIVFDEIKKSFTAQIVEVTETHHKNKVDINLTFGTPRKTKYVQLNI